MKAFSLSASLAVSIAGMVFSGATLAQSTIWNWVGDPPTGCDPNTCSVGGVTATVSGYGAETSTSSFLKGSVNDVDMSGLGVKSKDNSTSSGGVRRDENTRSPNHSIDNFKAYDGNYSSDSSTGGAAYAEVLAIDFDKAVRLTEVAVAWTWNDSDAMIFRWDGGVGVDPNKVDLENLKANELPTTLGTPTLNGTLNGWTLVSAGQFSTSGNKLSFTDSLYSSHWLVSTALGQSTATDSNNDGFKVSTFTGNVCAYAPTNGVCKPPGSGGGQQVPEPGTLALAAAAFLGLTATRRRQRTIR